MTTLRQLIIDGLREAGIIEVGGVPDADQHDEALRRLKNIISSLFGHELGESLQAVNFGTSGMANAYAIAEDVSTDILSTYVPSNARLVLNLTSAATVYLDPNPRPGARVAIIDNKDNLATLNFTINGNGRQIESGSSVVLATNGLAREWFYRDDLSDWVRVTDLIADDQSPFPSEFDDYLITLLAFRLNPRYGAETGANLVSTIADMKKRFRARYRQGMEMGVEDALFILPSTGNYGRYKYDFNRG